MRSNKLFLLAFLFIGILGIQSFSNCNPTPPPNPGLIEVQVTTVDTNNQPLPYTLIGLFADSELLDYKFPQYGCLIDTFYTDASGYKKINYVSRKYSYYSVAVMPDHHSTASASVSKHQLDTTFVIKPALPLLSININTAGLDSVIVQTIDLPYKYRCNNIANNLQDIPFRLNYEKVSSDAHFFFDVAPNQTTELRIFNYSGGGLVKDTTAQILIAETVVEFQIN